MKICINCGAVHDDKIEICEFCNFNISNLPISSENDIENVKLENKR